MRFAVVMYGGVSLAIYINGVVQELLRLVRATAPEAPLEENPSFALLREPVPGSPDDARTLKGTERVYRKLGQLVRWESHREVGAELRTKQPGPDAPILTRFVVDILSGSSAGGINAIYLGKALANGESIDSLKQLWVDEGDIARLVNDRRSVEGLDGLAAQKPPRSVLNSKRMYWQLLSALRGMSLEPSVLSPGKSSYFVDELDVWITATDIRGLLLPIDLYNRVVFEKRYRNIFHFRFASPFATGDRDHENDFVRPNDPFLAFAGRATASFPFAFEPMALEDIDEVLRTDFFRSEYEPGDHGSNSKRWEKFFRDYVSGEDRWYRRQAFGDGGYLDNKPFTWSTQTLMRRRADRPVDRKLIFVEPDPSGPFAQDRAPGDPQQLRVPPPGDQLPASETKPDALANVRAAVLSLPRKETIRDDLEALLARNRELARLRRLTAAADSAVGELWKPLDRNEWLAKPIDELVRERGAAYLTYHRLKLADLLDDLAALVAALLEFEANSAEQSAIRCLLQAWFDRKRRTHRQQKHLLLDFDFRYRLRRLNFLHDRIDVFLQRDDEALRQIRRLSGRRTRRASLDDTFAADLIALKQELNEVFVGLRGQDRALRLLPHGDPLRQALAGITLKRQELLQILQGARDEQASVANADLMLFERPELLGQIEAAADALATRTRPTLSEASRTARAALERRTQAGTEGKRALEAVGVALLRIWDHYEEYDSVMLPIAYASVGEADRVEVIRISPEDATDLLDVRTGRRKLGGNELQHFGGFFKRAWRRNDLMWGRLDAAEILISTMLPEDEFSADLRRELLTEAQLAIVEEELVGSGEVSLASLFVEEVLAARSKADGSPEGLGSLVARQTPEQLETRLTAALEPADVLAYLRTSFSVDRTLDPEETWPTAARATTVTGELLDALPLPVKAPARWAIRSGRVASRLVEAATPRSFWKPLWRYWLALLLLVSALMIVGGAFLGAPATAKAGWVLLLVVAGGKLAIWIADDVLRGYVRWAWVPIVVVVLAVVGLAGLEIWRHLESDADRAVCKVLPDRAAEKVQDLWPWADGRCPS